MNRGINPLATDEVDKCIPVESDQKAVVSLTPKGADISLYCSSCDIFQIHYIFNRRFTNQIYKFCTVCSLLTELKK